MSLKDAWLHRKQSSCPELISNFLRRHLFSFSSLYGQNVCSLIVFPLCYIYGTIPLGIVKSAISFRVSIIFSRYLQKVPHSICRKIGTQYTKGEHLCNRSPPSPQKVLWPCLAVLPCVTILRDSHTLGPASHSPLPSLCRPGNSCTPHAVFSHLSSTQSLHYHWYFTDMSVRGTTHVGTWGWEEAVALQKTSI